MRDRTTAWTSATTSASSSGPSVNRRPVLELGHEVQLDQGKRFDGVERGRHPDVVLDAVPGDRPDEGGCVSFERGHGAGQERVHPHVHESHGVEHAGGHIRHPHGRVAGPGLRGDRLGGDGSEIGQIEHIGQFGGRAAGSRGGHERPRQVYPGEGGGQGRVQLRHGRHDTAYNGRP